MKIALLFLFALAGFVSSQEDSAVHHVTSKADFEAQLKAAENKLVVVYMTARFDSHKWIAPHIKQLAKELKGKVVFLEVDIQETQEEQLFVELKIHAVPTFIFIKNKKELERVVGASLSEIEETVKRLTSVDHHVSSKADFEAQLEAAGHKLVVLNFYATWFSPCKAIAPKIEEMAKEYKGEVVFLKVDVDEIHELAAEYKIRGMPTFVFMKNKSEWERVVGAFEDKIKEAIKRWK